MAAVTAKQARPSGITAFITPDLKAPEGRQSEDARRASPRRSYSLARGVVGGLGILLPIVLWAGEPLIDGSWDGRGSISAYYHSGVRDYFVGTLAVVAVLLLIYKFFQHSLDNVLTWAAGGAALAVAIFPTHVPDGVGHFPTPLQESWGEDFVAGLHYTAAATFFLCMAAMSWLFGRSETQRADRPKLPLLPEHDWKRTRAVHWICAAIVSLMVLLLIATSQVDVFGDQDIWIAESVALIAFGVSWIYKGFELDLLIPSLDPDEKPLARS